MIRRVRFEAAFRRDLRAQLSYLLDNADDPSWIERLRSGIDEAVELVAGFPDVGSTEAVDGTRVLRRLILRRLPYVIWFARDAEDPSADIWFLRLFHARQDRAQAVATLPPRRSPRKR